MTRHTFLTRDADATRALGAALGRLLQPGALVLLRGPLGAGKTTLVQGIAAGLGISARVLSPTFTLVHEYPLAGSNGGEVGGMGGIGGMEGITGTHGPAPRLVHMDFYRLADPAEAQSLGLDDYLAGDDIVVVEWPDRAGGSLPPEAFRITLALAAADPSPGPRDEVTSEAELRRLTFEAEGEAASVVLTALIERLAAAPVEHAEPADA